MVATAAAGLILVLHPSSDRLVRVVAVAVQGVGQVALYLAAQRTTDLAEIERYMEQAYDGHMTFYLNPLDFGAEALKHLRRVADVYPGGSGRWLSLFALAAVAGLVIAAVKGSSRAETIAARFLLSLVAFAFVGALLGRFPFGPDGGRPRELRHTAVATPCGSSLPSPSALPPSCTASVASPLVGLPCTSRSMRCCC